MSDIITELPIHQLVPHPNFPAGMNPLVIMAVAHTLRNAHDAGYGPCQTAPIIVSRRRVQADTGTGMVELLSEILHDAYEAAAAQSGWETQLASRKPWSEVPEPNKVPTRAGVHAVVDVLAHARPADEQYLIEDGRHRWMAHWIAGVQTARCIVLDEQP